MTRRKWLGVPAVDGARVGRLSLNVYEGDAFVRINVPDPRGEEKGVLVLESTVADVDEDTREWVASLVPKEPRRSHSLLDFIREVVEERADVLWGSLLSTTAGLFIDNTRNAAAFRDAEERRSWGGEEVDTLGGSDQVVALTPENVNLVREAFADMLAPAPRPPDEPPQEPPLEGSLAWRREKRRMGCTCRASVIDEPHAIDCPKYRG